MWQANTLTYNKPKHEDYAAELKLMGNEVLTVTDHSWLGLVLRVRVNVRIKGYSYG